MISISRLALVTSFIVVFSVPAVTSAQFVMPDTAGAAKGGTVFTNSVPQPAGQSFGQATTKFIKRVLGFSNSKVDSSNYSANSGYGGGGGSGACTDLAGGGFVGVVDCLIVYFNYFIYLIVSLTVVYSIIGAFKMISSEEKRDEGKNAIIYGIVGLFVMMSIWGFVNILEGTFQLGRNSPMTPAPIQRAF